MRTGQLIAGRYRLEEQIGSGGMGVVWRAVGEDGRMVAIKRATRPSGDAGERTRRRMKREARIAAGLHHPHVVSFIEEVLEGHERWLVMEYVPSRSLAQILTQHGPLIPQQVTHLGAQIASALEAVHAHGVVHRDVKPGNVLVTADGTAKLTDFGISRPITGDVTVTDSGVIGGTVAFLASEVAGGEDATPASDVFALGATLFAAVEGTPPFGTADNPLLVLRRAAAGELLPCSRAGPLTPVLSALLQPDPADRPDAARARQLLQDLAATTASEGSEPWHWDLGDAGRPWRSRRRMLVVAGSCLAVLATVAGLLAFHPGSSAPTTPLTVLGDPHTADPCALIDAATFNRFGATSLKTAYGNFNRCDVLVKSADGAQTIVTVDLDNTDMLQGTGMKVSPPRVIPQPLGDGQCDRVVVLADQSRVSITAKYRSGPRSADLCARADVATQHALAVISKGAIPRRTVPFDTASLARVNACSLLDTTTVARAIGTGPSSPETGFGNWVCSWHSSASDITARVYYDRNQPLTSQDGIPITLAGHAAYITQEPDEPDCVTQVVNRRDFDANGDPVDEILMVAVSGPRPVPELCTPA
ncbi:MAG: serine/threonine-protein kinase, partial [Pseudonocardiaceae bacterium]